MTALTYDAVATLAYRAGLRGEPLAIATAITTPESGRDPGQHNLNAGTRDDSWGLWQINTTAEAGGLGRLKPIGVTAKDQLLDPYTNARAMYLISSGGSNFNPWTTFKNGLHKPYLTEARRAAQGVESRGGGPGGVGSSSSPADTAPTVPVRSEDVVGALASLKFNGAYVPSRYFDGLTVRGLQGERTLLSEQLIGGTVTLSVDEVSQLDLEVTPHGPVSGQAGADLAWLMAMGTPVDWYDLHLVITSREWAPNGDVLKYVAHCRSAGAEKLRSLDLVPADQSETSWTNYSPTEVAVELAGRAGLRFVGSGSNKRDTIVRRGRTAEGQPPESPYELLQRLAKEEGFWFFESAGIVYFAPPSWLATRMPHYGVSFGSGTEAPSDGGTKGDGIMGLPQAEQTAKDDLQPGMPPRTITMPLPRWRSDQIRPGMVCDLRGLPGFEGAYITTTVTWPQDGGLEPGMVTVTDPTDPVPDPPADDTTAADGTSTAADGSGTAAAGPVGSSHSALDMVTVALRQVGDQYVYGAEASPTDPDPDAFDCSELVQWACAQVGVSFVDGSTNQIGVLERAGTLRPIASCARIRGALLWFEGHVAISLGDGTHTVEARGRQYGVVQATIGSRFTKGGLIPGLVYPAGS